MLRVRDWAPARIAAGMMALAVALALVGCGKQGPQTAARTTLAATATLIPSPTAPPGPWTTVTDLSTVATIAPHQLRTQFKAFAGLTSKTSPPEIWVRRSDDFGKTYHDVSLPPIPGATTATNITFLGGEQSPLNPDVYFLTAQTQGSCGKTTCQYQFVTMDGGSSWKPLNLPVHGILGVQAALDARAHAQGQRLFGVVTNIVLNSSGVVPPGRLVVSHDGGATWALADVAIHTASQWIYDYAPVSGGATIFALAGPMNSNEPAYAPPLSVWRSGDAGATWRKAGPLPGKYALGVQAATNAATGKPMLYALVADASDDYHLDASSDGGATWPATYDFHKSRDLDAPNAFPGLITTMPDGSELIADYDYSTLAWKPGFRQPHHLLPAPPNVGFVQSEVLAPSDGAGQSRLWITSADSNGKVVYDYATIPQ